MTTQAIPVTRSEVLAAKLLMMTAARDGRTVEPKIRMIAEAGDPESPATSSPYVVDDTRVQRERR